MIFRIMNHLKIYNYFINIDFNYQMNKEYYIFGKVFFLDKMTFK